jgi:aryl sulfotransferase
MDSTIWNQFRFRDDDIVIATYGKSGTTWLQQIVDASPFHQDAPSGRRAAYPPVVKYIYIARDGRDVVWSLYNHHANANAMFCAALNDTPGRIGPPLEKPVESIRQYFLEWLDGDGHPFWPFWENIGSWWAIRDKPNLLLLHFVTADDCARYETIARERLGPECAAWLATGRAPA